MNSLSWPRLHQEGNTFFHVLTQKPLRKYQVDISELYYSKEIILSFSLSGVATPPETVYQTGGGKERGAGPK